MDRRDEMRFDKKRKLLKLERLNGPKLVNGNIYWNISLIKNNGVVS